MNLVYYIDSDRFLCHEDCQPHPSGELFCHGTIEFIAERGLQSGATTAREGSLTRAHLCITRVRQDLKQSNISDYYRNRYDRCLPHFKQQS